MGGWDEIGRMLLTSFVFCSVDFAARRVICGNRENDNAKRHTCDGG